MIKSAFSSGPLRLDPHPAADVLFPRGSIVVCRACDKPIYKLQQSIYNGEPAGKSAWKYAPVQVKDILELIERNDLEAGQRAMLKTLSLTEWHEHCDRIPEKKAGDFMDCPACGQDFARGLIPDTVDGQHMFPDKGYVIELAIIPPQGQSRRLH